MEMICFIFKCGVSYNVTQGPRVLLPFCCFPCNPVRLSQKLQALETVCVLLKEAVFWGTRHHRGDTYFLKYILEMSVIYCDLFYLPDYFVVVVQCRARTVQQNLRASHHTTTIIVSTLISTIYCKVSSLHLKSEPPSLCGSCVQV